MKLVEDLKMLIGGDKWHFQRCRRLLDDLEIPVAGEYCDEWEEGRYLGSNDTKKADKHVIVIPDAREVLMFSKSVGYVKLV